MVLKRYSSVRYTYDSSSGRRQSVQWNGTTSPGDNLTHELSEDPVCFTSKLIDFELLTKRNRDVTMRDLESSPQAPSRGEIA